MLLRIPASKDTTITNKNVLGTAVVYSNAGASEILQVFKTYQPAQQANILISFMTGNIQPMTGSFSGTISYRLVMRNVETENPNPGQFDLEILPLTQSWNEGSGQDLDYWTDMGSANWVSSSTGLVWSNQGARPTTSSLIVPSHFDTGHEDIDVDVSSLVSSSPYGLWVGISSTQAADTNDYYLKAFRSRNSHSQYLQPYIEARWNDATGSFDADFIDIVDATGTLVGGVYDLRPVYYRAETPVLHTYLRPIDWNAAVVNTGSTDVTGTVLTRAFYRVVNNVTNDIVIDFGTGSSPSVAAFSSDAYTQMSYNDSCNYFQFPMQNLVPGFTYRFEVGYFDINNSWRINILDNRTFRVI